MSGVGIFAVPGNAVTRFDHRVHAIRIRARDRDGNWTYQFAATVDDLDLDAVLGEAIGYLTESMVIEAMYFNGRVVGVEVPMFVELAVVETDPGVRGDTSGGGGKPAVLETGAVVRVPLFVGQDEIIKVDTRSGEYVSRVK